MNHIMVQYENRCVHKDYEGVQKVYEVYEETKLFFCQEGVF